MNIAIIKKIIPITTHFIWFIWRQNLNIIHINNKNQLNKSMFKNSQFYDNLKTKLWPSKTEIYDHLKNKCRPLNASFLMEWLVQIPN